MSKRRLVGCLTVVLMLVLAFATAEIAVAPADPGQMLVAHVDFSEQAGIPLFKRQNVFSPSHSFVGNLAADFVRDAPLLKALRSESQRVDLFMGNGGLGGAIGMGRPDAPSTSFLAVDTALKQFYRNGVLPYLVYFATPNALYDKAAAASNYWKYPPVDYDAWAKICGEIAGHYRALGWPLAAHEIWNEPDWFDASVNAMAFYGGTWDEYLRIYDYAVRGIREADPYAMVGGLSLAEFSKAAEDGKVEAFLSYVRENALPLDFISYHCYVPANYPRYTQQANAALDAYGDAFATTGLHLNEFHISMAASTTSTEKCVSPMMDALLYFVETPQVTSVNWACFRVSSETGIQMIDSRSGKRFAAYHLLSFYNRMPVDRVRFDEVKGVRGLASMNDHHGSVLLCNSTWQSKEFTLELDGIPYDRYRIVIYGIDEENSNYGRQGGSDEASVIDTMEALEGSEQRLSISLSSGAAIYLEIQPDGMEALTPVTQLLDGRVIQGDVGTVIRREYYFENRASTMFSEFDLATFTAWAGMGDAEEGLSKGSVYLENVPATLAARPRLTHAADGGTDCFLVAQYLDDAGHALAESVYSALDGTLPLDGTLYLVAPEDFSGVLKLTYGIRSAGCDQTLKIAFDKE